MKMFIVCEKKIEEKRCEVVLLEMTSVFGWNTSWQKH